VRSRPPSAVTSWKQCPAPACTFDQRHPQTDLGVLASFAGPSRECLGHCKLACELRFLVAATVIVTVDRLK